MTVVSRDDDESVVEFAQGSELVDRGFDGVVELEEVAESAVVVEGMPESFSTK